MLDDGAGRKERLSLELITYMETLIPVTLCGGDCSSTNGDDTNHRCPKYTMRGVARHGRNRILPVLLGA